MTTIKISKGMSADDVLDVLGKPKATEVVGDEGLVQLRGMTNQTVRNLLVEWTYRSIKLTLARRELAGIMCYRVIKMEVTDATGKTLSRLQ